MRDLPEGVRDPKGYLIRRINKQLASFTIPQLAGIHAAFDDITGMKEFTKHNEPKQPQLRLVGGKAG